MRWRPQPWGAHGTIRLAVSALRYSRFLALFVYQPLFWLGYAAFGATGLSFWLSG